MKNRILAAAVAALSFTACDSYNTARSIDRAPEVVVAPAPVIPSRELPAPVTVAHVAAPEVVTAEEKVRIDDGLPLEHEHRTQIDHLARAKELKDSGDFEGALTEARRAIFDDGADEQALRLVVKVGRILGHKELVASSWGRLALLTGDDPTPLIQQARALITTGDFEGAVKIGKEAAEKDSGNAEAFQAIGRAYLAAGSLKEAIDHLHRAVELAPDHGYAMNNLGFAYLRANQNEQAALVLEKAAELLPHVAYVQNNLGVALERLGRTEEAKAAYQKAMDLSPRYVKARVNVDRMARVAKADTQAEVDQAADVQPDQELPADAVPQVAPAEPREE